MLGLQGNSSSKVYRCVACSATFNGLASLLVHQATHASALSKVSTPTPTQPIFNPHGRQLTSTNSCSEHLSLPSDSPSPSFYICDCGEEFQDFGLMLEHKRSHVSQIHLINPLSSSIALPIVTGSDQVFSSQQAPLNPIQPNLVLSCPSTSKPPAVELSTSTGHKADVSLEDGIAMVTTPQGQRTPPQDDIEKQLENMSSTAVPIPDAAEDVHFQNKTNSVSSEKEGSLQRNDPIMKLLASAYMKSFPLPQPQDCKKNTVVPKQEVVPVAITPRTKTPVAPINDLSIAQLRRLLAKPGIKTKAPSISRIIESSRKKVVSLTKTLSPVVVLETRQKLMDPGGVGVYGRYQCGRCRRVFQNLDRLTEHHFLHKKERIKCCRRCKQLIIGRVPLPDNHVCPQLGNKSVQSSKSLQSKQPFASKIVPFHSLNKSKKVFFCPLCKHSYARRWNLKTHKCQGPRSVFSQQAHLSSAQKMLVLGSNSNAKANKDDIAAGSQTAKSVAVGTEVKGHIKVEVTSSTEQSEVSQLAWAHPAQHFSPFLSKSSMTEMHKDPSQCGNSFQGDENSWDADNEESNEGQWTMPLDDEMDMLNSAVKVGDGSEMKTSAEHAEMDSLRYFVRDGIKRYPCTRCQKTYSRPSTLRRHLRLCGFRPRVFGSVGQSSSQGSITLSAGSVRPMFSCYVCGKSFNRKDNMMAHRKKCQFQRTVADVSRESVLQSSPSNATTDSKTQGDDGGNWGIMSLPSVLPRRVTCECGVGFTSPRLLLEHLQKHAQESYTCPTCGETVNSWADYEVHLQIHMHPHHQLMKGLQPQRSQPLLLRFQQQPQQQLQQQSQQPSQPVHKPPVKQPFPGPPSNPTKKQQRIVCTRCGNTFATRCSLRRHISWNRCKGSRVINPFTNPPKAHHCAHCNSDFPNTISLIFHQRSGACKPAIKPVRCPVCLRWFGTVDSLQKHLLTHKQSESYRCDVCQGTYPNLKSLKNHRRRIHRIMAGDTQPKTQEQLAD
ncbi:zinc finger protein 658B [Parambassis ranga]|uniref:Zinc finger protein 658B-like n=1 Tax=Parambassis ranga TaxID=210632 RepID=A0A6P7JZA2_9TELE|nr:zinc finger protein 658B-like [Parambassis ranga]XP_028282303.1 zinc finger protein 658B-like [Parambassis ranga]